MVYEQNTCGTFIITIYHYEWDTIMFWEMNIKDKMVKNLFVWVMTCKFGNATIYIPDTYI